MAYHEDGYNGWSNRSTWNVALWIGNDEPLYRAACEWVRNHSSRRALYVGFIRDMGMMKDKTPDGIQWISRLLDYTALNDMMRELID